MEKYKLILERDSTMVGAATNISVSVNGMQEDIMTVGATRVYELDYKVTSVRFFVRSLGMTTLDQTITVDPTGYNDIRVRYKMNLSLKSFLLFTQKKSITYNIIPGTPRGANPCSTSESNCAKENPEPQNTSDRGHFCPRCGTKNTPDSKYCRNCGLKL